MMDVEIMGRVDEEGLFPEGEGRFFEDDAPLDLGK